MISLVTFLNCLTRYTLYIFIGACLDFAAQVFYSIFIDRLWRILDETSLIWMTKEKNSIKAKVCLYTTFS